MIGHSSHHLRIWRLIRDETYRANVPHFQFSAILVVRLMTGVSSPWNTVKLFGAPTHRIHGTGIFTYINGWFLWNHSCRWIYNRPMDPEMGYFQTGDFWGPTLFFCRRCFSTFKDKPRFDRVWKEYFKKDSFPAPAGCWGCKAPGGGQLSCLPWHVGIGKDTIFGAIAGMGSSFFLKKGLN